MLVLPIQTPPEKMDEMIRKVQEIKSKKKFSKVDKPKDEALQKSKANLIITSMVLEEIQEEKKTPMTYKEDQSKVSDL
jgi:hypothetical protein